MSELLKTDTTLPIQCTVSSILIAENDRTARGLLAGWLEDAGYVCDAAQTADALSRARQQPPTAALVTVTSLDDGGMWVLRSLNAPIRHSSGTKGDGEIATIALAATQDLALVAAARNVGAFDCLPWPSSRAAVLDSVKRAIHWRASTIDARQRHAHVRDALTRGRERLLQSVRGLDGDATQAVLLAALEAHSPDLYHHAHRLARGATALALALHLDAAAVKAIRTAALLHDVGRLALPVSFARSAAPETDDDVMTWRMHVSIAEDVLNASHGLSSAASIVSAIHERFDGTGYPLGRAGDTIPLAARAVAIVDAYDTLVSQRGFDGPVMHDDAMTEIVRRAGTQFDPDVVRAWLEVGDRGRCS